MSLSFAVIDQPSPHCAQKSAGLRVKGKNAGAGQRLRPFEIRRWRLDEDDVDLPEETSPALGGLSTMHVSPGPLHTSTGLSPPIAEHTSVPQEYRLTANLRPPSTIGPQPFEFPLSSDHLLHLIHHNVFRAFITNKRTVNIARGGPTTCPINGLYRHDLNPHAVDPSIPPSLAPTTLQQNRHHSIWIDFIPFPRIRDNLIRHEGLFDHWDLIYDLVGELMSSSSATCVRGTSARPAATRRLPLLTLPSGSIDADDGVTAGRRGLIVWGEPHEMQSWEATPGFLEKWAWAVEGCEELVEISNRWRMRRGEDPMRLPVVGKLSAAAATTNACSDRWISSIDVGSSEVYTIPP